MTYSLLYHPLITKDIKALGSEAQHRIESAISSKLLTSPEVYGKPLSGTLKRYWKLRVGDYRVVYKVVKNEIFIFAIVHRRQIYKDVLKRLCWNG